MTSFSDLRQAGGIHEQHIRDMSNMFQSGSGYAMRKIRKRGGSLRTIYRPSLQHDRLLKQLSEVLPKLTRYCPPNCVHGFVKGRGTFSNATQHLGARVVLNVDLRNFFPNISTAMVEQSLIEEDFDPDLACVVARATTIDGGLAPGLSPSPFLSNLVFLPTDNLLSEIAKDLRLTYTRYADDLTFSGVEADDSTLSIIRGQLERYGWSLNDKKTRFMRRGGAQYVTGLYVGDPEQPHIPRRIKRLLRQQAYFVSKYSYRDAKRWDPTMLPWPRLSGLASYASALHPDRAAQLHEQLGEARQHRKPVSETHDDAWDTFLGELDLPTNL